MERVLQGDTRVELRVDTNRPYLKPSEFYVLYFSWLTVWLETIG